MGREASGCAAARDPVADGEVRHAFAERVETLSLRLMDERIPFEVGERRLRYTAERVVQQPALRLAVDDQPVEIAVFPLDGIRQSPVSPVDGKPMRRADAAEVAALINVA